MNLVKLEENFINLDRLNYTSGNQTRMLLFFSGPYAGGDVDCLQTDYMILEGKDAAALYEYLNYTADDLTSSAPAPAPAPDEEPEDEIPF